MIFHDFFMRFPQFNCYIIIKIFQYFKIGKFYEKLVKMACMLSIGYFTVQLEFFLELNKFSLIWQPIAYIIGSFICFGLFITIFFCIDKWLSKRGYTKFRACVLKAFGLKVIGFLLLFFSPHFFMLFYIVISDMVVSAKFDKLLRINILKMFHHYFDLYELLQRLLVVPALLLGEMVFLLIATAIIWQIENIYYRLKKSLKSHN